LIGLWDETSIEFFWGIIIICAIFYDLGQYSSRSMALNIYEVWNFNSGNYLFTTDTK